MPSPPASSRVCRSVLSIESVEVGAIADKFPTLTNLMAISDLDAFFVCKMWVDLNYVREGDASPFKMDCILESFESYPVEISSQVISLGKVTVESVQKGVPTPPTANGVFVHAFKGIEMCPFLENFVDKLKALQNPDEINAVLENFAILHIVRNNETKDVLFCTACLFELTTVDGCRTRLYRCVPPKPPT